MWQWCVSRPKGLGIVGHRGLFRKAQVRGDGHAGSLVELGQQVDQQGLTDWVNGRYRSRTAEKFSRIGTPSGLHLLANVVLSGTVFGVN